MDALGAIYRISKRLKTELKKERHYNTICEQLLRDEEACSHTHTYKEINIDEEWVAKLEEGLPYVEKAIEESRHELKKEGNVVRIDQVKKVSSDSIRDLAHHSNYVSRGSDKESELRPNKLYVTANSDNYLLYENRFLYTLLYYLRDFVENRYIIILNMANEEGALLEINCNLRGDKKRTKVKLSFEQEWTKSKRTSEDSTIKELINRIDAINNTIVTLQSNPLMKMMADMTPLKLPIVATNIIKNNLNFREAYNLFDYILAYNKQGYEIEEKVICRKRLSEDGAEELSSVIELLDMVAEIEVGEKRNQLEQAYIRERMDELKPEERELLSELLAQNDREWQIRLDEAVLAKDVRIDALRAKYNDFSKDEHMDEASFKRLTEEKKAFDRYYAEKWARIKKEARKKYIWSGLRKKRTEGK